MKNEAVESLLDYPVLFQRTFFYLTGDVKAALMLSQAYYWTKLQIKQKPKSRGWFYKTHREWTEEICLSKGEQRRARIILRRLPFWEEHLHGVPAKLFFRVQINNLYGYLNNNEYLSNTGVRNVTTSSDETAQLGVRNGTTSSDETAQLVVTKRDNYNKDYFKDYTKTTSERKPAAQATPSNSVNTRKPKYDPRVKELVVYYQQESRRRGFSQEAPAMDWKRLRQFLLGDPTVTTRGFQRTLQNAFASTKHYPLQPGFRLIEFLKHYGKYARGPILEQSRNGSSSGSVVDSKTGAAYNERFVTDAKGIQRLVVN